MSTPPRRRPKLEDVRACKARFADTYANHDWFRGVGITRAEDGWALRVNVDPESAEASDVPSSFAGVPVDAVPIALYRKR